MTNQGRKSMNFRKVIMALFLAVFVVAGFSSVKTQTVQASTTADVLNSGLKVSINSAGSKVTLKWGKVSKADGYFVYGSYIGSDCTRIKTITSNATTSLSITKLNSKNLKKNGCMKFYVMAYQNVSGKKTVVGKRSLGVFVCGPKYKSYSNVKSVSNSKSSYVIEAGNTAKISAKVTLVDSSKTLLNCTDKFRYSSNDTEVATVSDSGIISGVANGSCYVRVFSVNGLALKLKVVVTGDPYCDTESLEDSYLSYSDGSKVLCYNGEEYKEFELGNVYISRYGKTDAEASTLKANTWYHYVNDTEEGTIRWVECGVTEDHLKSPCVYKVSTSKIGVSSPTSAKEDDGMISGLSTVLEYSTDGTKWYSVSTDGLAIGFEGGTEVQVRYKESTGMKAGESITLTIPKYGESCCETLGETAAYAAVPYTNADGTETISCYVPALKSMESFTSGVDTYWRSSGYNVSSATTLNEGTWYHTLLDGNGNIIFVECPVTSHYTKTACTETLNAATFTGKAPTSKNGTNGKISGLKSNKLYEYSADDGSTWTTVTAGCTAISNLEAGAYKIRIPETEYFEPSAAVDVAVPAYKDPTTEGYCTGKGIEDSYQAYSDGTDVVCNYSQTESAQLESKDTYIDNDGDILSGIKSLTVGTWYHYVENESGNHTWVECGDTSHHKQLTVNPRDISTIEHIDFKVPSSDAAEDGKIKNVDDTMEYSLDDGENWKAVEKNATEITGLTGGQKVLLRYAATDGFVASESMTLVVPKYGEAYCKTTGLTSSYIAYKAGDSDKIWIYSETSKSNVYMDQRANDEYRYSDGTISSSATSLNLDRYYHVYVNNDTKKITFLECSCPDHQKKAPFPYEMKSEYFTGVATSTETAADGKITGLDSTIQFEYRKSDDTDWTTVKSGATEITGLTAGAYAIRTQETELYKEGNTVEIIVKKPYVINAESFTATAASTETAADGKISGLDSNLLYEYQVSDSDEWIQLDQEIEEITGLTAGTYKLRTQARKYYEASEAVEITVPVAEKAEGGTDGGDADGGDTDGGDTNG